ncbi:hypothetical protein Nepgr_013283 [Nepenthes gracilis]|uniref:Uncharacterized protein n=1 Tax=Nepenthes gracilis TaxID=150966 RepID=A0AAD3XNI7_NEPGR|nr:hypothetical protein Nepgr_013283 [Nepenthes gracilis]
MSRRINPWRKFDGCSGISRSGRGFGEGCWMRSPPLPPLVRLDNTVRFGCVAVEHKVVLIQVSGCTDDLFKQVRGVEKDVKALF